MSAYINVTGLTKTYKQIKNRGGFFASIKNFILPESVLKLAVDGVSFAIEKGESVGFIGPNGAGKSTTVKMLTGILSPSSGNITVGGLVPHKNRKKHVARLGAVFGQRTQLFWDLPAIDTLEMLRYIYRIEKETYKKNMTLFNEILDLHSFVHQPVRQLSLGQRMRADIAAALLHDPECVFLDEPTIGLDVVAKQRIREFICYINKEKKVTILFTTHDMLDIEKTCQRMIIIDLGKIIYDGSIHNIKKLYGKERELLVDLHSPVESAEIGRLRLPASVKYEVLGNSRLKFNFNRDEFSAPELISIITKNLPVLDLTIKDAEIEDIIRGIYEGGTHLV